MKNSTKILTVIVLLFALVSLVYYANTKVSKNKTENVSRTHKDATYIIGGQKFTLKDGVSKVEQAPGSSSFVITSYFGNEVGADFDSDGREDVAFLLSQNTGGSGTFYYVVAALNKDTGYVGSEAIFLGDRIAPQTTEIKENNIIVVNYAERKPGESFAEVPSVGKSIWLKLDPLTMQFGEVVQDFEGEVDVSKMNLTMKTWNWIGTSYNDESKVVPKKAGKFTLTFKSDGNFSMTTDCNSMSGKYSVKKNSIVFTQMISTLMACEDSQEQEFSKMVQDSDSFLFTNKGELVLNIKYDSGSVIFK